MDNILKLLLGVLSVAGVIAMVTPTNMTVAPPPAAELAPVAEPLVSPDASGEEVLPEEEFVENEAEDDPFSIGEPTIDGNPINQQGQQSPNESSEMQQPAAPIYVPTNNGVPTITGYTPPPVYNVPTGPNSNFLISPAQ